MQKIDYRSLKYGIIGTQEPVLVRAGKQVVRVQELKFYCIYFQYFESQTIWLDYSWCFDGHLIFRLQNSNYDCQDTVQEPQHHVASQQRQCDPNSRLAKRREILIFPRTAGNTGNSRELLVIPGNYWEISYSLTKKLLIYLLTAIQSYLQCKNNHYNSNFYQIIK